MVHNIFHHISRLKKIIKDNFDFDTLYTILLLALPPILKHDIYWPSHPHLHTIIIGPSTHPFILQSLTDTHP